MGLRCLLGHDFGPSGVVREHEEDGNEMVVIEREIRRCRRCNEEQVLSESKEVRAIRAEDEVRADRRDAEAVAPAGSTQGPVGVDDGGSPDATPLGGDGGTPATDGAEAPAVGTAGSTPNAPDEADESEEASNTSLIDRAEAGFDDPEPEEEDAVILDDSDDGPERERGAWPDSGDVGEPVAAEVSSDDPATDHGDTAATDATRESPGGTPDHDTHDAPEDRRDASDASRSVAETAAEEDAELLDAGVDGAGDGATNGHETTHGGTDGSWPAHGGEDEGFAASQATSGGPGIAYGNTIAPQSGPANGESHDDGYETSYIDTTVEERDGDGTIVSAGSDGVTEPGPGVQTEYYCPSCGQAWSLDSSLRTGDICPECQTGYIAERER
jgi:hypothetical protein